MEIDLDPETADSLAEEATERGFESPDAYARWLLEHRDAVVEPPGERLQARLERVEGELQRLRRTLEDGFETEITVESGTDVGDGPAGGAWFDERSDEDRPAAEQPAEASTGLDESDGVSEFAYSDDLQPPSDEAPAEASVGEEPDEAADDDAIAEALADVELEDEDDEQATDEDA